MISDANIRDRFIRCLAQVRQAETQKEIAEKIGSTQIYLSALPKIKNPQIPASVIANFCVIYHYSPAYIILGKGEPKTANPKSKEEKWDVERGKYLDLISKLLDGLMELKGQWDDPVKELVQEAKKRRQ